MSRICDMRCPCFGAEPRSGIARRIDGVGWGLFLLWIGLSFLLDLGWGIGLLGIGVLTLSMQALRRAFGLVLEGFWVMVGIAFTVAGVLQLGAFDVSLLPIPLVLFGAFVLVLALRRTKE